MKIKKFNEGFMPGGPGLTRDDEDFYEPADENRNIRIVLNEDDFKTLISGKEVEKDNVKIILSDIGYAKMINIIKKHIGYR
jgi:hypothetical protein